MCVGSEENKFGNFCGHFLLMNQQKYCGNICKLPKFTYQGGGNKWSIHHCVRCSMCQHERTMCTKLNNLLSLSFSALWSVGTWLWRSNFASLFLILYLFWFLQSMPYSICQKISFRCNDKMTSHSLFEGLLWKSRHSNIQLHSAQKF